MKILTSSAKPNVNLYNSFSVYRESFLMYYDVQVSLRVRSIFSTLFLHSTSVNLFDYHIYDRRITGMNFKYTYAGFLCESSPQPCCLFSNLIRNSNLFARPREVNMYFTYSK